MSKMAELAYDIEQLWIEGYGPTTIAIMLECPPEVVYGWLESENLSKEDSFDPYETVNS
jgi:hypothetical protein